MQRQNFKLTYLYYPHPLKHKRLIKNTLIYTIGTFGSKILVFLLVPIYSYFVNKEGFGYYDLVNTTINLLIPIFTFQIADSLFRWLIEKDLPFKTQQKIITNGSFILSGSLIVVLLASLVLYFIHPIAYQGWITLLCLAAICYPFLQQVTRGLGKSKVFALNGITYSFIYLLANIVFVVWLQLGVQGIFISSFSAFFLSSVFITYHIGFFKFLNFKRTSLQKPLIINFVKYSLPLVPNTISWWLIESANKYIILIFLGVSANGLFAMSSRFPIVLVMLNQIFTLAWQEQAIIDHKKNDAKTNTEILKGLIKVQFSLVIILSLLTEWGISLILSPDYFSAWKFIPILFLGAAFNAFSAYYGGFYLGAKRTKSLFSTSIISGVISLILALILVKPYGLYGIAIATTLGYISLFIIRKYNVRKITSINSITPTFFLYGTGVGIAFFVCYLQNTYFTIFALIVLSILILFDNKNLLYKAFSLLKNRTQR